MNGRPLIVLICWSVISRLMFFTSFTEVVYAPFDYDYPTNSTATERGFQLSPPEIFK
uniref:Uncharacterized protein n=1 Tax=Anguilla anguilla TaxID=7936 RepID=A0A0E9XWD7_ANGAN